MNVVQKNYAKQTNFTAGRFISLAFYFFHFLGPLPAWGSPPLRTRYPDLWSHWSGRTTLHRRLDAGRRTGPEPFGDWTILTILDWVRRPALDLHEIRLLSPTPWNSARSCWIWGNLHHHLMPKQLRTVAHLSPEILGLNMGLLTLQCTCRVWTFRNRNWQHLSIRNQHTKPVQGQRRGL